MDSSNHWYGHAHAFAAYCGLDGENPPRINGILQHGWTFVHGFGHGHNPPRGFSRFVWSDVCRRRGQAIGWRDYLVTGAPFLYLDQLIAPDPDAPAPEGTIWYPFHGTMDYETVSGSHDRLIAQIKETEPGPVTVCLYYVEYEQPETRALYEAAGFRVICHGKRGVLWSGGNHDFLQRQLTELRRHTRVASNRLSTAIFYGAALGLQAAVYGDPMEFVGVRDGFNGEQLLEWTFADMHGAHIDPVLSQQIADSELGRDAMMSAHELREVFGWQDEWLLQRQLDQEVANQ